MSNLRNSSEDREIDLMSYLPGFLSDYRELKAVFSAEDPELSELHNAVQTAREACFINYCSKKQLVKFEKMLGIYGAENDDISGRRQRVLIRWSESPPYTVLALNSKLAAICGDGNFSVFRELDKYKLTVFAKRLNLRQLEELSRMLSIICPANLIVKIENRAVAGSSQNVCLSGLSVFSAVIRA